MNKTLTTMLNQQITDAEKLAASYAQEIDDMTEHLVSMTPTLVSAKCFNDIRAEVAEIEKLVIAKENCERSIEAFRAALNA